MLGCYYYYYYYYLTLISWCGHVELRCYTVCKENRACH